MCSIKYKHSKIRLKSRFSHIFLWIRAAFQVQKLWQAPKFKFQLNDQNLGGEKRGRVREISLQAYYTFVITYVT